MMLKNSLSKTDRLFLKACLLTGPEKELALTRWQSSQVFDDCPQAIFRLLGLLYHQHSQSTSLANRARLKGLYRYTSTQNGVLLYDAESLLKTFALQGISVMVLKGLSLLLTTYKSQGVRLSTDIDLLIKPEDLDRVTQLLLDQGWLAIKSHFNKDMARVCSSRVFIRNGIELDLHWRVIYDEASLAAPSIFWDKALPLSVGSQIGLQACYEDQWVHTIVHGLKWNPFPPTRWIADAVMLLSTHQETFDWDRVIVVCQNWQVMETILSASLFLKETFYCDIPDTFLDQMRALDRTEIDSNLYSIKRNRVRKLWETYRRWSYVNSYPMGPFKFLQYVRLYARHPSWASLLKIVGKRLLNKTIKAFNAG